MNASEAYYASNRYIRHFLTDSYLPCFVRPVRPVCSVRQSRYQFKFLCNADRAEGEAAGISVVLLGNLFREHLHTTVNHYITALRLDKAKHLLENRKLPISEIAAQCGFASSCYFARVFKEKSGILPGKYRGGLDCATEKERECRQFD